MTELKTTESGYKITYTEWKDKWECAELGLTSVTLSGLRKSIKSQVAKMRKLDKLPLVCIDRYTYSSKMGEVFYATLLTEKEVDYVWVSTEKGTRSKESLNKFALECPKVRESIRAYEELIERSDKLRSEADKILSGITRVSYEDLLEHRIIKD